jgi:hypothetical protein
MRHVHGGVDTAESATLTAEDLSAYAERAAQNINARRSCIALLTPYNGGNLGDASILDAVVANIGRGLPDAQFTGICSTALISWSGTVSAHFLSQEETSHGTQYGPLS